MYVIIIVCLSTAMVKPTINKERKNEGEVSNEREREEINDI
jgi:hypothetical protein